MCLDPVRVSANSSLNQIRTPLIKNRLDQVLLLYDPNMSCSCHAISISPSFKELSDWDRLLPVEILAAQLRRVLDSSLLNVQSRKICNIIKELSNHSVMQGTLCSDNPAQKIFLRSNTRTMDTFQGPTSRHRQHLPDRPHGVAANRTTKALCKTMQTITILGVGRFVASSDQCCLPFSAEA
ncbi:hypothetical protein M378DRAFT_169394 [Amanita muscaria Koide BX008]|uniref:Uncharacterized protein n=1 Tax=Amanita muscaria (strain Koide BX008) TaxID=946122 RepID=A0A0C2WRG8_AMAMK|nr:hypothetical protein M378DRAFT_169394 [Amanita muscaria Koide BX008]